MIKTKKETICFNLSFIHFVIPMGLIEKIKKPDSKATHSFHFTSPFTTNTFGNPSAIP